MNQKPRVIISGGGTGGHIFPAISIANAIKAKYPEADILFVGAIGRMEMQRVPQAGYPIKGLPVQGFDRKHLLRNIPIAIHAFKSVLMARKIIRQFRPQVAVGVGGYASGPTLKACAGKHIPYLLQEQNSYAGVTNKMLADKALKICVAYEGMERFFPADRIVLTGNPVRQSLLECHASAAQAREQLGLKPDVPTVLVVGGSLGAQTINRAMINGLEKLAANATGVQVLWQTGKKYLHDEAIAAMERVKPGNVIRTEFIDRMDLAYRAATLVVSRAGASSISELQLLGKAAILVPATFVAEDHQRHNALALVSKGAAVLVHDDDSKHTGGEPTASVALVDKMLQLVHDEASIAALERNIKAMALADAAAAIVDQISTIIDS